MQSLGRLLQKLADSGVDFVVVGGFAGVLHGSTLVTRVVDLCAALTAESVQRLRICLRDLHPRHRMTSRKLSFLDHPTAGSKLKNLYLETDWGTVDILTKIAGLGDFARVRAQAMEIDLFDRKIRVLSLEDLIQAKEALGREKDLLAVKELRAIAAKSRTKQA